MNQLLERSYKVNIIARNKLTVSPTVVAHPSVTLLEGNILELPESELLEMVNGTSAVVSCLGHTINFQGLWGNPRDLCAATARRIHDAINKTFSPAHHGRFILMNTVGVKHHSLHETRSWSDELLLTACRKLLPPHADNEKAAGYLERDCQPHEGTRMDWVVVRPDSLIDADTVSDYDVVESPTTTILNGRNTSRINVANFMVELIQDDALWKEWAFRMPVVMDTIPDGENGGVNLKEDF